MSIRAKALLAIEMAARHKYHGEMVDSALLCFKDANNLYLRGEFASARTRALKALAYSVGILHPDYLRAAAD